MKKSLRFILLSLLTLTVAGAICVASADTATVSIRFYGVETSENGTESVTSLNGSFRILQDGIEVGVLEAGNDALSLDSTDRVRVEPLPETMPQGWQIPETVTDLNPDANSHTVIRIRVSPASERIEATPTPEPTPEPTPVPTDIPEPKEDEGETVLPTEEPDDLTWEEDEPVTPAPQKTPAPQATPTPTLPPYTPKTAVYTPEPELPVLTAGEGKGTLRVNVFLDSNHNGEQGKWEKGAAGFPVYILNENGEAITKAVSGEDGYATFDGLEPGNYIIRLIFTGDWGVSAKGNTSCMDYVQGNMADSDPVPVRAGEITERGVGVLEYIHMGGYCWLETLMDGIKMPDELMLPGVKITLEGQRNGLTYETESDENGNWYVERLKPGFYTLTVYAPDGMMFTKYSRTGGKDRSIFHTEGVSRCSDTIDTNDNVSRENMNVGFAWSGRVTGICFLDANYNGLYDEGELPLKGVKITAIKPHDEEIAKTYSGEDGTFTLSGLRGNTYTIRAVLPQDGCNFTKVVSDPAGNHFEARKERRENFWYNFVLGEGECREIAVGAYYPATVSGNVYMDDDFSGSMDGKENPVRAGQTVILKDADGRTYSTKTNIKGKYKFDELVPGYYTLEMDAMPGYAFTRPGEGNIMLNRTGGEGYTEPFFVPLGENVTGKDIGMIRPATVQGTVFADRNDNGTQDAGEDGLKGTVVRLMSDEGEQFRAEIGADGGFLFDAVMPGEYWLEYELPENGIFAKQTGGRSNTISGTGRIGSGAHFTIRSGDEFTAPLCGGLTLGRITGAVFHDTDGNGEMKEGEGYLAGAEIILTPSREDLEELRAVTGDDGAFGLEELHPDDYTLTVRMPDGYVCARTHLLQLPLQHGIQEQKVTLTVKMGDARTEQYIGAAIPSGLNGRLWLDDNCNGLFDEGEQTPSGYTVTVTDDSTGTVFAVLTTNENGCFGTEGMVPGPFTVSYDMDDRTEPSAEGDSTFHQEDRKLVMHGIQLEEGSSRDDLRLGMIKYTTVSGQVWIDRGTGAEPLAGAEVILCKDDGQGLQSVTTGADGGYRFDGLLPGSYILATDLPTGCVVVEPEDSRLNGSLISVMTKTNSRHGESDPFDVIMGADRMKEDIGSVLPGRIGDLCWLDLNENGLQDTDEPGISGVKIELLRDGTAIAETESGDYGFWRFTDVYPAAYTLRVTPPAEVKATVCRNDIPVLCSVLTDEEGNSFISVPVTVRSDQANYNADLGFVCRQKGVLPGRLNEGKTQDWRKLNK